MTKIESLSLSLSRYPRLSPLPLTFLRKARGEVPDDLNSERESRLSGSTLGSAHSRSPALSLETQAQHWGGVGPGNDRELRIGLGVTASPHYQARSRYPLFFVSVGASDVVVSSCKS